MQGYFCREPGLRRVKFAFTNYGVSVGLQAVNAMPERIAGSTDFSRPTGREMNTIGRPSPMSWPAARISPAISFAALADRNDQLRGKPQ